MCTFFLNYGKNIMKKNHFKSSISILFYLSTFNDKTLIINIFTICTFDIENINIFYQYGKYISIK